ncbi:MAG: hypothetical protein JRI97_02725 [Deltaproteobacteria bacterium]|nr:hypothetical protein [Deltaproteobacteria bacterium]
MFLWIIAGAGALILVVLAAFPALRRKSAQKAPKGSREPIADSRPEPAAAAEHLQAAPGASELAIQTGGAVEEVRDDDPILMEREIVTKEPKGVEQPREAPAPEQAEPEPFKEIEVSEIEMESPGEAEPAAPSRKEETREEPEIPEIEPPDMEVEPVPSWQPDPRAEPETTEIEIEPQETEEPAPPPEQAEPEIVDLEIEPEEVPLPGPAKPAQKQKVSKDPVPKVERMREAGLPKDAPPDMGRRMKKGTDSGAKTGEKANELAQDRFKEEVESILDDIFKD